MNKKRNIFLIILAFIVSTFFAIILTNYYINEKQKELLNSIYETTHKNIFEKTQNLINDKQNTSLAIAISLSKDETLYTHLKNKDFEKLNYVKIAKTIETNSKYKNIDSKFDINNGFIVNFKDNFFQGSKALDRKSVV